ncbi:hypothetical protein [Desulfosudis oleivorans]|uniref:Uncharacterized protein n=1 Tax=Desulfosudis oleivorans (strain DSM 6200 / JCM 39069 / Hxd3) TaxID=96561 RepID=A8ZRR0_DESOH|nr:hypothetical protein [Desulfosudis oleivorans]ABW65827.1 hypothetical protein Dole_0017 [Desulfosudis oleivorans Hxd3]
MDLNDLIPVLVFLAIVGFQVIGAMIKRARKPAPDGEAADTGAGPGGVLGRVFSRIQQEMERAAREVEAKREAPSQWDLLMPEDAPPQAEKPAAPAQGMRQVHEGRRAEAVVQPVLRKQAPPAPSPAKTMKRGTTAFETALQQAGAAPAPAALPVSKPSIVTGSAAELRRAVVWSEILGPPVALRKTPEDRWEPDVL